MNRSFDFYEFAGIIVPGAVLLLGTTWLFPQSFLFAGGAGVTFGELGVFIIIAYAAGEMVQGVGSYIEWMWWRLGPGIPSKRVLAGELLNAEQYKRVVNALRSEGKISRDLSEYSTEESFAIVGEVYAVVAAAGRATRVDKFNGFYGLLRGLAAAFSVLLVASAISANGIYVTVALGVLLFLAAHRMNRFSKRYALELFIQYANLASADGQK